MLQPSISSRNPSAQASVGDCYYFGRSVEKLLEGAFEWDLHAAENNSITAQFNGEGVEKDYEKADYFYTLATNQGHKKAQKNLAYCYGNGQGVK